MYLDFSLGAAQAKIAVPWAMADGGLLWLGKAAEIHISPAWRSYSVAHERRVHGPDCRHFIKQDL